MRLLAGLVLAATMPVASRMEAQGPGYYRVDAESLACVIENVPAYLSAEGDTVYINTEGCPPSGEASILDLLTNEAPDIPFAEDDTVDRFLTLRRDQLECLSDLVVPQDAGTVRFYPDACRIEAEQGG